MGIHRNNDMTPSLSDLSKVVLSKERKKKTHQKEEKQVTSSKCRISTHKDVELRREHENVFCNNGDENV